MTTSRYLSAVIKKSRYITAQQLLRKLCNPEASGPTKKAIVLEQQVNPLKALVFRNIPSKLLTMSSLVIALIYAVISENIVESSGAFHFIATSYISRTLLEALEADLSFRSLLHVLGYSSTIDQSADAAMGLIIRSPPSIPGS